MLSSAPTPSPTIKGSTMANFSTYQELSIVWKVVFGSSACFGEVMEYYDGCCKNQPRFYHDAGHILDCITAFNNLALPEGMKIDRKVVLAALFFHDIIYLIDGKDNEAQSAFQYGQFASRWKEKDWYAMTRKPSFIKKVKEAILATSLDHAGPNYPSPVPVEAKMVHDLDILFLGRRTPKDMLVYEEGIWSEYISLMKNRDKEPDRGLYFRTRSRILRDMMHKAAAHELFMIPEIFGPCANKAILNLAYLLGVVEERERVFNSTR